MHILGKKKSESCSLDIPIIKS